jgi:NADH-quinone oxidoreductase subunit A
MTLTDYVPVLIQLLLALGIAGGILLVSHIFGQRARGNYIKDAPYECGLPAEGVAHPRFGVKFYVVAMLFILFDIEVIFLLPWLVNLRPMLADGFPVLGPLFFFLGVLTLGLVYELKKKGIDWDRQLPEHGRH